MYTCSRCVFVGDVSFFTSNNKIRKMCTFCREKARILGKKRNCSEKRIAWRKSYDGLATSKQRRRKESEKYYKENKDTILKRNMRYHNKNAADRKLYISQWRRENKDKTRQYWHNRRARKNNAKGKLTAKFIRELMKSHPYCEYCNSTKQLSIEHIIPLSRDGSNLPKNITISCKSCNSSKGSKLLNEWRS